MRILYIILISFLFNNFSFCQSYERQGNQSGVLLASIYYGGFLPQGDMKDRFGVNFDIGIGTEFITKKSNLIVGVSGSILFGNEVKEDPLVNLRNSSGNILAAGGGLANVALRERGFQIRGYFGKLFTVHPTNKRSGIRVILGAGLLQHKIRIQDNQSNAVQVSGDYIKGYDRLSNGLAIHQYIGYHHLSKNRLINIYAGFEFTQAFTQNRRDFNWDTMSEDNSKRTDILTGFSVGWSLPFYNGSDDETIYY